MVSWSVFLWFVRLLTKSALFYRSVQCFTDPYSAVCLFTSVILTGLAYLVTSTQDTHHPHLSWKPDTPFMALRAGWGLLRVQSWREHSKQSAALVWKCKGIFLTNSLTQLFPRSRSYCNFFCQKNADKAEAVRREIRKESGKCDVRISNRISKLL